MLFPRGPFSCMKRLFSTIRNAVAEQKLRAIILKETGVSGPKPLQASGELFTFRRIVEDRYLPMQQGTWSPAYKKTNSFEIRYYLVSHFGHLLLRQLGSFEIQVWLNDLAEHYSHSVVRHSYVNICAISQMAKKLHFLAEDPAEDIRMPQTKPVGKPRMTEEQILALIGGIHDLHDLCLMYIGIFCGPRASKVFGLQWKSWTGAALIPHGTAYEGKLYPGRLKTRQSRAPIAVPEQVRPVIEAWHKACPDPSPEALMFATFGRGDRKGQAVPRWGKNFLKWRMRPVARKLQIREGLVTFQVMRRTLGTDMQEHGTLKDVQGALRHASIKTTGDIYVQRLESSVLAALNSRTDQILNRKSMAAPQHAAIVPAGRRMRSATTKVQTQLDQVGPSGSIEVSGSV
jgi:integrase